MSEVGIAPVFSWSPKERDQKIIDLSEQLQGHMTDVFVRIYDLAKPPQKQVGGFGGPTLRFSSVFPGKMLTSQSRDTVQQSQAYNLFFIARNGSWTQEIRWAYLPNRLAVANRVVRDGAPLDKPLLLKIDPEFPGLTPPNDAWDQLPPYTANSSERPADEGKAGPTTRPTV